MLLGDPCWPRAAKGKGSQRSSYRTREGQLPLPPAQLNLDQAGL